MLGAAFGRGRTQPVGARRLHPQKGRVPGGIVSEKFVSPIGNMGRQVGTVVALELQNASRCSAVSSSSRIRRQYSNANLGKEIRGAMEEIEIRAAQWKGRIRRAMEGAVS